MKHYCLAEFSLQQVFENLDQIQSRPGYRKKFCADFCEKQHTKCHKPRMYNSCVSYKIADKGADKPRTACGQRVDKNSVKSF
jgi:hypothetical protein